MITVMSRGQGMMYFTVKNEWYSPETYDAKASYDGTWQSIYITTIFCFLLL